MTSREYREALAALGISQARLGRLLDIDKGTPNRWATGERAVPSSVALVLRVMLAGKLSIDELEKI